MSNPRGVRADYSGRRAVVTGGANGIGAATVARLAAAGARVIALDVEQAPHAETIVVDLRESADVVAAAHQALRILGGVEVLVNCAAVSVAEALLDFDLDTYAQTVSVNLTAPLILMRELAFAMTADGHGRVVNVSSVHARVAELGSLAYDISKAGLEAATRTAALELAQTGVLVNAVAPGYVRTRMSIVGGVDELETEDFQAAYVDGGRLPLRRPAEPAEIAETIAWLASTLNTYVTGQTITVDGGLTTRF